MNDVVTINSLNYYYYLAINIKASYSVRSLDWLVKPKVTRQRKRENRAKVTNQKLHQQWATIAFDQFFFNLYHLSIYCYKLLYLNMAKTSNFF